MPFQFRKESIEEDLNSNFPSQGQGNPPLYYSLSEVVVPTYSINQSAEGSGLPQILQTAWDFSTGFQMIGTATTVNLITNPGFWQVDVNAVLGSSALNQEMYISISDGLSSKKIFQMRGNNAEGATASEDKFVVFLRSGDTLTGTATSTTVAMSVWYRQIAEPNGTLVNPLGYSAA